MAKGEAEGAITMRDPKRIQVFCNRLARAWELLSDMRFGQLMMNALGEMQANGRDPFFSEEDEMIRHIEAYCKNSPYSPYRRKEDA